MQVTIVTPQGKTVEQADVRSITLPTGEGVITVMDDHLPIIAKIVAGMITIEQESGETSYLSISRGILEIQSQSEVNIMADTAERAEDIDIERAKQARQAAEEFMKQKKDLDEVDFARIQAKIEKELARETTAKWRR